MDPSVFPSIVKEGLLANTVLDMVDDLDSHDPVLLYLLMSKAQIPAAIVDDSNLYIHPSQKLEDVTIFFHKTGASELPFVPAVPKKDFAFLFPNTQFTTPLGSSSPKKRSHSQPSSSQSPPPKVDLTLSPSSQKTSSQSQSSDTSFPAPNQDHQKRIEQEKARLRAAMAGPPPPSPLTRGDLFVVVAGVGVTSSTGTKDSANDTPPTSPQGDQKGQDTGESKDSGSSDVKSADSVAPGSPSPTDDGSKKLGKDQSEMEKQQQEKQEKELQEQRAKDEAERKTKEEQAKLDAAVALIEKAKLKDVPSTDADTKTTASTTTAASVTSSLRGVTTSLQTAGGASVPPPAPVSHGLQTLGGFPAQFSGSILQPPPHLPATMYTPTKLTTSGLPATSPLHDLLKRFPIRAAAPAVLVPTNVHQELKDANQRIKDLEAKIHDLEGQQQSLETTYGMHLQTVLTEQQNAHKALADENMQLRAILAEQQEKLRATLTPFNTLLDDLSVRAKDHVTMVVTAIKNAEDALQLPPPTAHPSVAYRPYAQEEQSPDRPPPATSPTDLQIRTPGSQKPPTPPPKSDPSKASGHSVGQGVTPDIQEDDGSKKREEKDADKAKRAQSPSDKDATKGSGKQGARSRSGSSHGSRDDSVNRKKGLPPSQPQHCDVCDADFKSINAYKTHLKSARNKDGCPGNDYQCDRCKTYFQVENALRRHQVKCNPAAKISCPHHHCDKTFTTEQYVKDHLGTHTDLFVCIICKADKKKKVRRHGHRRSLRLHYLNAHDKDEAWAEHFTYPHSFAPWPGKDSDVDWKPPKLTQAALDSDTWPPVTPSKKESGRRHRKPDTDSEPEEAHPRQRRRDDRFHVCEHCDRKYGTKTELFQHILDRHVIRKEDIPRRRSRRSQTRSPTPKRSRHSRTPDSEEAYSYVDSSADSDSESYRRRSPKRDSGGRSKHRSRSRTPSSRRGEKPSSGSKRRPDSGSAHKTPKQRR